MHSFSQIVRIVSIVCSFCCGVATLLGVHTTDSIHRFFDSSPFSADEKYIAIAELPRSQLEGSESLPYANISLFLLKDSDPQRIVIDKSLAWGAQLGAQVQVVGFKVFYNVLTFNPDHCIRRSDFIFPSNLSPNSLSECHRSLHLHGRIYNINSKTISNLPCEIYHVSADGRYTSTVNLWNMQHSQRGYGIDWLGIPSQSVLYNSMLGREDGVWVNDVERNHCSMLYSISEIAQQVQLNNSLRKVYGFHTKWSFDSLWIMVVLRTLEPADASDRRRIRVQHLTVVKNYLQTQPPERDALKEIKYILSWASKPFYDTYKLSANSSLIRTLCDGNHPNWKPNSHTITMNLQLPSRLRNSPSFASNNEIVARNHWSSQWRSLPSKFTANLLSGVKSSVNRDQWYTVAIDIDSISSVSAFPLFHSNFLIEYEGNLQQEESLVSTLSPKLALKVAIAAPFGVGHPSFSPDGQFIITDTYSKEIDHIREQYSFLFQRQDSTARGELLQKGAVYAPILLYPAVKLLTLKTSCFPLKNMTEKLLDVPVAESSVTSLFHYSQTSLSSLFGKDVGDKRKEHPWRCDPHPAWSASGRLVALNVFNVSTKTRRIFVLKIPQT